MNENICENCDNFMFTYIDDKKILYNCCKKCGNKEIVDINDKNKYKIQKELNISDIFNSNPHILNDYTLPKLSNKSIKCPNINCDTNIKKKICNISYLKYDKENMKFMYICNTCGQKWTNTE